MDSSRGITGTGKERRRIESHAPFSWVGFREEEEEKEEGEDLGPETAAERLAVINPVNRLVRADFDRF